MSFFRRKNAPGSKQAAGNQDAQAPGNNGDAGHSPQERIDEQVYSFVARDPAFRQSGYPATREVMMQFARGSGNGLVFHREMSLVQNGAMRIHVHSSSAYSWYIAYAIQGAFTNLAAMNRDFDYSVIDHALPGEDSEPLRKALAILQEGFPAMHIALYRKVESQDSLRSFISAGTPRMMPKAEFDPITDLIPIPLTVAGLYSSGEPGDASPDASL